MLDIPTPRHRDRHALCIEPGRDEPDRDAGHKGLLFALRFDFYDALMAELADEVRLEKRHFRTTAPARSRHQDSLSFAPRDRRQLRHVTFVGFVVTVQPMREGRSTPQSTARICMSVLVA